MSPFYYHEYIAAYVTIQNSCMLQSAGFCVSMRLCSEGRKSAVPLPPAAKGKFLGSRVGLLE